MGDWKLEDNENSEGSIVKSLLVCETMKEYQRQKELMGAESFAISVQIQGQVVGINEWYRA